MSETEVRIDFNGATITRLRFFEASEFDEQIAEIGVSHRTPRLEPKSSPERRLGGVQPAEPAQRIAQIVVRFGDTGGELDSALTTDYRCREITCFAEDPTKVVVCRCETRIQFDSSTVTGARL